MTLAAQGVPPEVSRSPQTAPELVQRGRARQEMRDWKGALADFERALQLDPRSADAYAARGQWWATDGKDKKALADFDRALAIDATHRDAHFFRATARERAGDLTGARADYAAVLAVDPSYAKAAEYLADVEQRLGVNSSPRQGLTRPPPAAPVAAAAPASPPQPTTGLRSPPGDVIEARMPPKGPNEVNIALIGAPSKRDEGEDFFYRHFGQMRGIDFILQASSAKDFMPTLAKLKRSGKRVKTLIIGGHGDQNQVGIQISSVNDILREWDVDRELMAREVDGWKQKRARVLSNLCPLAGKTERTGAEIQQRAALEKQLEIADAQIADWERMLQDAEDAYGVMAPDGFIMLFNCFAAADESHLAFSKALARTLFGNNRGKLMVSATAVVVREVNSTVWSILARAMEGYWHPIGDTFVTGAWRQFELDALPATTPATKYLAVRVRPAVAPVPQAIATTNPTVSPQPDSGKLTYTWSGACGNAKGPSCSLDTSRVGNKGLFSSIAVRDAKGREGSEAFCQVTTAELLIGLTLEPAAPASGQPFVARAQVTRGTQPPNTYWVWRTSGAVTLASKDGAVAQLTAQGDGAVQVLLFGYGAFGKEMIFDQMSVPVSPARGAADADASAEPARTGRWVLQKVTPQSFPGGQSDCYPGRTILLSDGVATFTQGYAPCGGAVTTPGSSQSTIRWSFPRSFAAGETFVAPMSIARTSDSIPLYGGASVVFYYRSQSAVGVLELKGRLDDPALSRERATPEGQFLSPKAPAGRPGDKMTIWVNVAGESGSGDVFYEYGYVPGLN